MRNQTQTDGFLQRILIPTYFKRFIFFFFFDILIITLSLFLSFFLRFEFRLPLEYKRMFITVLPYFILIKLISFSGFRMYKITWRYVGINDLCNIVSALVVANSVLLVLILVPFPPALQFISLTHLSGFPRSIFLIDGIISLILLSGIRILKRLFLEVILKQRSKGQGKKTIIVGAGNTGEMVLRDIVKQNFSDFYPIGFLEDDPKKIGSYIHGVKVIYPTDRLKAVIRKYNIEAVIIAIPSLDYKTLRNIYNIAKESGVSIIKIVPRIYDFQSPNINLKSLEDISIEDLIGRQPVDVDYKEIEAFIRNRVILITGAGGSIGSEIATQACAFHPERVILFDNDETELHNISLRLKRIYPHLWDRLFFITGDIRDKNRVEEVFKEIHPQIVFHAAAYKHVPMMEYNPKEAVKVNIFGTYNLAKASVDYGVEKFIMISTDKAVRPTSVMGATKRMAEYVCKSFNTVQQYDSATGNRTITEFISVRFGNVLGSRGSVLPLFMEQLKYGGPLTVTHKDMKRYFMTIPEAVSLVLQASVIGKGGEVMVLDMGEPVHITKLAEELIRIHGLEPYKDVDIDFVGIRLGEKMFEEILTAEEGTIASKHEKLFIAKGNDKYSKDEIEQILKELETVIKESSVIEKNKIRDFLKKYVKHFVG